MENALYNRLRHDKTEAENTLFWQRQRRLKYETTFNQDPTQTLTSESYQIFDPNRTQLFLRIASQLFFEGDVTFSCRTGYDFYTNIGRGF